MELLKNAKVETYTLIAGLTGRKIRKATRVVLADGRVIEFMESLSKREALRNAAYQIERGFLGR